LARASLEIGFCQFQIGFCQSFGCLMPLFYTVVAFLYKRIICKTNNVLARVRVARGSTPRLALSFPARPSLRREMGKGVCPRALLGKFI
jgi:hypothetical protein